MIADSTLESLQSFEKVNWARLCKDKIAAGVCNDEDVPGYFMRQVVTGMRRWQPHRGAQRAVS